LHGSFFTSARRNIRASSIFAAFHCLSRISSRYLFIDVSVLLRSSRGMLRRYATIASRPASRLRARGKSPVGLDHVLLHLSRPTLAIRLTTVAQFIQRQRALALWREIVRSTGNIPEEGARRDMRQFARAEFEQHRSVTDIVSIACRYSTEL
jgi:hypothetical protein